MYIKNITDLKLYNDYSNMTVRDNNFQILRDNKIYVYDNFGNLIDVKNLSLNYKLLTYNTLENLYLTHMGNGSKEYQKINFNYEEFDHLLEKNNLNKVRNVQDIFFDGVNSKYLVINDKRAYSMDLSGNYLKSEINTNDFYDLPLQNYGNCGCYRNSDPAIRNFSFTAIGSDGVNNYVAYIKDGSSYIAKLSSNGNLIDKVYIADNIRINSIVFKDNNLYALSNDGTDNYLYEISNASGGVVDPRIQEIVDKIMILLNNVGNTEMGIANIINVEAEKIKRVIAITNDPNAILDVNDSATEMIKNTAILEQQEYENLRELLAAIIELERYLDLNKD